MSMFEVAHMVLLFRDYSYVSVTYNAQLPYTVLYVQCIGFNMVLLFRDYSDVSVTCNAQLPYTVLYVHCIGFNVTKHCASS